MQHCTVRTQLKLNLSLEQVDQAAKNATHSMQKLNILEEKFLLLKRTENAKIKKLKLEVMDLCSQFETKTKTEEVECEQYFDLENSETWYEHKGVEHGKRVMTDEEITKVSQGTIFEDGYEVEGAVGEAFEDEEEETHVLAAV